MPKVSRWLRKKLNKLRGRREGPPTREQYNQQLLREAGERQAYENSRPASIASFPDSSSDSDVNNNSDQPLYRHREDRPPPPTSPDVYRPNPPRERQRLPSPPRYSSRRAPGAEIRRDRPQPSTSAPALRRTSCHSNLSSIPEEAEDQSDSGGEGDEESTPRRGQGRGGRRKSIDAETRHRRELRRQERDAAACQGLAHDSSTTEAEESDGEAREWDETFRTAQEEPQSSGDGEAGSGDEDDSSDC